MIKSTPRSGFGPAAWQWYNTHADSFRSGSIDLDVSPTMNRFCYDLAPGSRVLDAGCGSGRDVRVFLERGYRVGAFDASREMVASTRRLAGSGMADIRKLSFEDFRDPPGSWDAIWCLASLLHLDPARAESAIRSLISSLSPGGRLFASFKSGSGTRMDDRGRPFFDLDVTSLQDLLLRLGGKGASVDAWTTEAPASGGEAQLWSNAILHMPG